MTQKTTFALLFALLLLGSLAVSAAAQTAPPTQSKVNIIIDRELVRFAPQEATQELRLVITDQAGAELYDSGPLPVPMLDWALLDSKGEVAKGGVYLYTLTIKDVAGETSQRRGYLIVSRAGDADRVYVATGEKVGIGADNEAPQVSVSGSREATLGGAELPNRAPRNDISGERSGMQRDGTGRSLAEPVAPAQKNSAGGGGLGGPVKTNIPDDLIVNGNLIFTPAPARDITMQNNNFGLRFFGAPTLTSSPAAAAIQFWGNNSNFPGQLYLDAGATDLGALIFRTAPTAGIIAERMRVTSTGNVGIGTTSPQSKLEVNASDLFIGRSATGKFSGAAGFDFNPSTTADGLLIEQRFASTGESAGIYFDGDSITMWSPGDNNRLLSVRDEDGMTEKFAITGTGTAIANGVTLTSSRRFKDNVAPIANALDKVLRLQGVTFDWKKDRGGKSDIGFIAEDLGKVLPELVLWEKNGTDAVGVEYANLTAVTVEAVKELKAQKDQEIAALKAANAALEQKLATYNAKLAALEARDKAREARLARLENGLDNRPAHARAVNALLRLK